MKKYLPVTDPPITCFPGIANIFSILWVHKAKVLPWICDRYIQLVIRPKHGLTKADFYDQADIDNFIMTGQLCPYIDWMRNNQTTAHFRKFTDYVEYCILHNYYLEPCLDRYYLSCAEAYYKKEHLIHTTFVYGFDNEKKEVGVADFYTNGKYERKLVSYEEINRSIVGIDYIINLYSFQNYNYRPNIELMKTSMKDYLNKVDSTKRFAFSCPEYNRDMLYGLDFYDYISCEFLEEEVLDLRPFHILCDHKTLMKIRLKYLFDKKLIDSTEFTLLMELIENLINKSFVLRNLAIKYNLLNDKECLLTLKERCKSLKCSDEAFFEKLLHAINY